MRVCGTHTPQASAPGPQKTAQTNCEATTLSHFQLGIAVPSFLAGGAAMPGTHILRRLLPFGIHRWDSLLLVHFCVFPRLHLPAHVAYLSHVFHVSIRTYLHPVSSLANTSCMWPFFEIPATLPALRVVRGRHGRGPSERLCARSAVGLRRAFLDTHGVRVVEHGCICGCHHNARFHNVFRLFLCHGGLPVSCFSSEGSSKKALCPAPEHGEETRCCIFISARG